MAFADVWARPLTIGFVGGALLFAIAIRQNAHASARPALGAPVLHVPRARGPIVIDGELTEPDWTRAPARTGTFAAGDQTPARPFSEARALWDSQELYLALYAADEDIEAANVEADGPLWIADAFRLELTSADGTSRSIDVGPTGAVTDASSAPGRPPSYRWQSHARVAVDVDGTIGDPRDRDEEWVVEMAIPLASLGLGMTGRAGEQVSVRIERCDRIAGKRSCGTWHGQLVLGE